MIGAHIRRNKPSEQVVTMLALTFEERTQLRALLDRVLASVKADKGAYVVRPLKDPYHGRLIRDGFDITELTFETERLALEFRRRL